MMHIAVRTNLRIELLMFHRFTYASILF